MIRHLFVYFILVIYLLNYLSLSVEDIAFSFCFHVSRFMHQSYFAIIPFHFWSLGDPEAPAGPQVSVGVCAESVPT